MQKQKKTPKNFTTGVMELNPLPHRYFGSAPNIWMRQRFGIVIALRGGRNRGCQSEAACTLESARGALQRIVCMLLRGSTPPFHPHTHARGMHRPDFAHNFFFTVELGGSTPSSPNLLPGCAESNLFQIPPGSNPDPQISCEMSDHLSWCRIPAQLQFPGGSGSPLVCMTLVERSFWKAGWSRPRTGHSWAIATTP